MKLMNTIDLVFGKSFDEVTIRDLHVLAENEVPEGRQLEFKRDHYGKTDSAKQEFAADVSAMANAVGGYLIIGIDEKSGCASKICGIESRDADQLIQAVSSAIGNSFEPQITDFRVKWLPIEDGRGVLLIKIDRSWRAPHRVNAGKGQYFYIRDENGKHPMSVEELKRAFIFASELEERIRQFRLDRLALLERNEGPRAINSDRDGHLVLHVVPKLALTGSVRLQLGDRMSSSWPWPLGASGANNMYSLDGLVAYSGEEERYGPVRAFSTLFRNGIAEAVARLYISTMGDDKRKISLFGVEQEILQAVPRVFKQYNNMAIPGPYVIMISLLGVKDSSPEIDEWRSGMTFEYRSDTLLIPELVIDDQPEDAADHTALKPLLDLMWNAFGRSCSPSYDEDGKYHSR